MERHEPRVRTFALRSVWHVVDAGPLDGPKVGPFYLFKCGRWAAVSQVLGIANGRPTGGSELCVRCGEVDVLPDGSPSAIPRDDAPEVDPSL